MKKPLKKIIVKRLINKKKKFKLLKNWKFFVLKGYLFKRFYYLRSLQLGQFCFSTARYCSAFYKKNLFKFLKFIYFVALKYVKINFFLKSFKKQNFKINFKKQPVLLYYLHFSKMKNNYRIHLLDSKFNFKLSESAYSATKFLGRQVKSKYALQKTFEKFVFRFRRFFRDACYWKISTTSRRKKRFKKFNVAPLFKIFILFKSRFFYFEKFILRYVKRLIKSIQTQQLFYLRFCGCGYIGKLPFLKVRSKHRRRRKRRSKRKIFQKQFVPYRIKSFNKKYTRSVSILNIRRVKHYMLIGQKQNFLKNFVFVTKQVSALRFVNKCKQSNYLLKLTKNIRLARKYYQLRKVNL